MRRIALITLALLLAGCASSHVSALTWEATGDDRVTIAAATDGSSWYFYGHGALRYRRIKKSSLEVVFEKTFEITAATGFRLSIGPGADIHFSPISKHEALKMLELYGIIKEGEEVVVEVTE